MEAQRLAITSFFRTNFRNLTGRTSRSGWWVAGAFAFVLISSLSFAAGEIDGKPEKSDITIALPQPSGAPIPVFLAHEAGHGVGDARMPREWSDHQDFAR